MRDSSPTPTPGREIALRPSPKAAAVPRYPWAAAALVLAASCALPEYETLAYSPYATGGAPTGGRGSGGTPPGTGGASTTGGAATTGGARATGGARPTGGRASTGGASATGGARATGGVKADGGAPATGGDPPTGGALGAAGSPINYLDVGPIHGYCFGVEVIDEVEEEHNVESELCFPYSLPGTSWEDVAILGCNLNQPIEGGTGNEGTWSPDLTQSICVEGTGFTRIQIQGPMGKTDALDRWCANVPQGGGCVGFATFNTECWDGTGIDYMGEELQIAMALQPSLSDGVEVLVTPISGEICLHAMYVE